MLFRYQPIIPPIYADKEALAKFDADMRRREADQLRHAQLSTLFVVLVAVPAFVLFLIALAAL